MTVATASKQPAGASAASAISERVLSLDEFRRKFVRTPITEVPHRVPEGPAVTVIVTTFQHARFIRQTLDAILAQRTNFPFEVCLGEDQSTDGTREICREYAQRHPDKIRLFLGSRANNLRLMNRPTGRINLANLYYHARGRYVAMCEGDDYWSDPDKLQRQFDFLEANPGFGAAFHNGEIVWEAEGRRMPYLGRPGQAGPAYRTIDRDDFNTGDLLTPATFVPTASVMLRVAALPRFPEWFFTVLSADITILSLVTTGGRLIKYLDFVGCVYRKHPGGVTNGITPLDVYFDRELLYRCLDQHHGGAWSERLRDLIDKHRVIAAQWLAKQENLTGVQLQQARRFVAEERARRTQPQPSVTQSPRENAPHPFLNPPLEPNNADRYVVRSSILRAVKNALPHLHGTFLDIGCGIMPYRDLITHAPSQVSRYIGLDIETPIYKADVDLRWDGTKIPLPDASVDSAMATEVLEHCPDPLVVLKEARRVLKPGGVFFFTVPFVWPLHDAPWDFYRYTPFALERLLKAAGFTDIKLDALSGWNGALAQMIGLWLKRAPMPDAARQQMANQLWPLYQQLIGSDRPPTDVHAGDTMATGWSGLARVPAADTGQDGEPTETTNALPLLLVRSHEFNYSETFLEDHVAYLSPRVTVLHGFPFPSKVKGGQSVLPAEFAERLNAAVARRAVTDAVWSEYSRHVAAFLKTSGVKVALLESGLMGAFLHEACEQAGVPYVVHFHGVDAFGRELLAQWADRYRRFFGKAAAIIGVSRAMHAQLLRLGAPADRTVLGPYGVDTNTALAAPGNAGPQFVAVGRFVEKKAPNLTLQAFAHVHREVPAAKLTMIGDGPLLASCREWAKAHGLDSAVEFLGAQPREVVAQQMAGARVFVQHSVTAENGDSEGLPVAVLEAGAHGLPVVSTVHAGIPDAVRNGEDGFLVAERDVTGMAAAMLRLAKDSGLAAEMGERFRERVATRYSRACSISRLQGVLRAAMAGEPVAELGDDLNSSNAQVASVEPPADAAPTAPCVAVVDPLPQQAGAKGRIAADRNDVAAYLELGHSAISTDRVEAYRAFGEAQRLAGVTDEIQSAFNALHKQGALADAQVQAYRRRVGWLPTRRSTPSRRVLVVTNLLPPQEMGGFGRTVWEFSRELLARGHQVRVLTSNMPHLERKPTAAHAAFEPNVQRTLRLAGDWREGQVVLEPSASEIDAIVRGNHEMIAAAVRDFRPEVVMAGNLDLLGHWFVQEVAEAGIPVVHRLGNARPGYDVGDTPRSPLYCVASCSEWVNQNLKAAGYPIQRFAVLPPGSPLSDFYRAFPPARDKLRIAFGSLLMPYKGAHVLVDALTHLHQAGVDFECTVAGDSTVKDYVEQLKQTAAKHGFAGRLKFPGFLDKAELSAVFARSNTLVFPSVFPEPFGKTQIEAMAAGLLVISSGTGGSREINRDGETGLVFENQNARALAERLLWAHQHPARAEKLALAGQAHAFKFTTAASVDQLEALLNESIALARKQARSMAPAR